MDDESKSIIQDLLEKERGYLNHFFDNVDLKQLQGVLALLRTCEGMIVLTGIGKSGLIAKKMAVTLTSTGTRSIHLSPTNALHGDIGILNPKDIFMVLSKSGESDELLNLMPYVRNRGVKIVAVVSEKSSRLANAADLVLVLPTEKELCPYDMAPTTSTTIQGIVGDVLAIALMSLKKISKEEFVGSHPGGRLGKRVTMRVEDLMLKGDKVPVCSPDAKLVETLVELSNKQCGCVLIVDSNHKMLGIFTDGDLRRALQSRGAEALHTKMGDLMTCSARAIAPQELAYEAMKLMEANQKSPIMVLPVLDKEKHVLGLLKMHDIVQSGI